MSERTARGLAWLSTGLFALLFVSSLVFDVATKPTRGHPGLGIGEVFFTLSTASFPIVAILILARQPRNRIGWILMAIGLAWVIEPESYGRFALSRGFPGGPLAVALAAGTWARAIPPIGALRNGTLQQPHPGSPTALLRRVPPRGQSRA
jgi:hypothetical protein